MTCGNKSGFSLIELLVVIAILGILMGIAVAVLNPVGLFGQGRDSRRLSDLTTIQAALEQYFSQNGSYPASIPGAGSAWSSGGVTYLKSMPGDPSGGNYEYCVSGANYEMCATMETTPLLDDCIDTISICTSASTKCCLTNPF